MTTTIARPTPTAELRVIRELLTPPIHVLPDDATLEDLTRSFATDTRSHTAYLTRHSGALTGIVPFRNLRRAIHPRHGIRFRGLAGLLQRIWHAPVTSAQDAACRATGVPLTMTIRDALFHMDIHRLTDLPIVNARGDLALELTHDAHAKLLRLLAFPGRDDAGIVDASATLEPAVARIPNAGKHRQ